jgi:hypothetical protein
VLGDGRAAAVDALLPSAAHPDGTLDVPGPRPVRFRLDVSPSLPDPSLLDGDLTGLQDVLWQALRANDVAAYLGNPRPGQSETTFVLEPAAAPRSVAPTRPLRAHPGAIVLAVVAALALVGAGAGVWRHS